MINNIIYFLILILFFTSCEPEEIPVNNNVLIKTGPRHGYMRFRWAWETIKKDPDIVEHERL